ncbi:hypothetical protein CPC08DRAFT_712244 [Agrocybe pediades]|nr:hypothetical protein CPC08DRAFT_712244 [Agrocybe pediades]
MKFFMHLAVAASLIATALCAPVTIPQVTAALATINTDVSALITVTVSFDGSAAQAANIENDAIKLIQANNAALAAIKATATPFSLADGTTIFNIVKGGEPNIEKALSSIVAQKVAIQKLGLAAAVHQTLINLSTSTEALIVALVGAAPAQLKSDATALGQKVTAAFSAAIAVYA